MTNSNQKAVLEISEDVVRAPAPLEWDSPSAYTKRVWWVSARIVGSNRFWADYHHFHTFDVQADAQDFLEKVETTLGDAVSTVSVDRLSNSPHWSFDNAADPMHALYVGGDEWQREQYDRMNGGW